MSTRVLSTADARRGQVLRAAVGVFARRGYYGTSTTEVAKAAGISQAYLYRLFPDKEAMFIAVIDHVAAEIRVSWSTAVDALVAQGVSPDLESLQRSYLRMARDSDLPAVLLHASGAAAEPAVRDALRNCYRKQVAFLQQHTAASDEELRLFFATGLLSNVLLSIDAREVPEAWATALTGDLV